MKDLELLYRFRLGDKSSLQLSNREQHSKLKVLKCQVLGKTDLLFIQTRVGNVSAYIYIMCKRLRLRCSGSDMRTFTILWSLLLVI